MSTGHNAPPPPTGEAANVVGRMSAVDRFLPLWIGLAMAAGLVLGRLIPGLGGALNALNLACAGSRQSAPNARRIQ